LNGFKISAVDED